MKLKEYLKQHNLSQRDFAKLVNISDAHVSEILSGVKSPSLALAKRIQDTTNGKVSFEDLFNPKVPSRLKPHPKVLGSSL